MKKIIVVYHKDCMDGLASAFITKKHFETLPNEMEFIPVQYNQTDELLKKNIKDCLVHFVDFSLNRKDMLKIAKKAHHVTVIDHHKTAEQNLCDINFDAENVTLVFDMNKSGATLCYEYFESKLDKSIFYYIEDRDLWNWNLPNSKEINAALRHYIKPNDLDSFKDAYENWDEDILLNTGEALIKHQEIQVLSKIKKVRDIELDGVNFKMLNATENISEIGNAICKKYNTPALIFFITEKNEVVCSLRSTDELADVSRIAKALGGGGHRNACGFTTDIYYLTEIMG